MKSRRSLSVFCCAAIVAFPLSAYAASISVSGDTFTSDTSENYGWVDGSEMFEKIDSSSSTGTVFNGFTSLSGLNASDMTFTYSDLELDFSQSQVPTIGAEGFEYYRDIDTSGTSFQMTYSGTLFASGEVLFIRSHVLNSNDSDATGTAQVEITGAGVHANSAAFFAEVGGLTGGTRILDVEIGNFAAVDANGHFTADSVYTAVPEPATLSLMALSSLGLLMRSRRF